MAKKQTKPKKQVVTKIKKGKVHKLSFISTDRGGLIPLGVLKDHELKKDKDGKSKQIVESSQWYYENALIPLPFNAAGLLELMDNCSYFDACVRQIAIDAVGSGYDIVPREEGKENEIEKKVLQEFMNETNTENESVEEVLKQTVIDYEAIGWLGLEISRGADDKINGIFNIPAHTIRISDESKEKSDLMKRRYCQVRGDKKRWFKAFGTEGNMSALDGKELKADTKSENVANELIYRREYYPLSDYYGRPNILSAIGAVRGLIGVRDFNLSFFDNYGVPAALVTLTGEWEEGSPLLIRDFIDTEIKGTDNAHKTLVIEIPETGTFEWIPLVTDMKEGSFSVYFKSLRDEVLAAYKMPPYRIGIAETGKLGGSTAPESTKIYNQSVIKTLQKMVGDILNNDIIKDGLQIETCIVKFKEIDTRDMDALVKRWKELFGMAVITPGHIAGELGLSAEDMPHAKEYYILNTYVPILEAGTVTEQAVKTTEEDLKKMVDDMIKKSEGGK